jgi:hypothetical protein
MGSERSTSQDRGRAAIVMARSNRPSLEEYENRFQSARTTLGRANSWDLRPWMTPKLLGKLGVVWS